jgi:hypothetical protein
MDINGKELTDEELEAIQLPPCRMCEGKASVRRVSQEWWYVGCECQLKSQCTREYVLECVEKWIRRHGR